MHNVDQYNLLTEIQQIENILRGDFEACPLHILINNRQYSVVALLISLGLCKNKEKNTESSTIDGQTLKSVDRFIEIYYEKERDVDYFTTVSKKANKLTVFLKKGDIKSDAYIVAKKEFFNFFNEHQAPNHDYSETYKESMVNLVDAITSPDGLSDTYYLPSFYRDIEEQSNNQLSNSNKKCTYGASHASIEIFNISPLNKVNVEKKNAIFRPIIKGILKNTYELLNAENAEEKEIFQERLYEFLAEYIEYKTLLFDKQLIKHSKYHLYTLQIIAMYRKVLQDRHIVGLLKTFFDQYQSIFLQEEEYNVSPNRDTSIKSIKINMLMSAHSILEKNSILNNDSIEPFNSDKKHTLDFVFNCLLAYNPAEQKLGDDLTEIEKKNINHFVSIIRNVNVKDNIANLSELFCVLLDYKRENFCSVHFEIFDILNKVIATDLSCIEFIKLSILASDFLKTYEKFQGESRYFFETLEKNIKKLFSFPLSKSNKKIILDFYIRYVGLKNHLLTQCADGSTILQHALVEFPELFFNYSLGWHRVAITKSKFEDFKSKVLAMKYKSINQNEISIFFDVVNSSIKMNRKLLNLSIVISSLIGIVLSLPLYLILAGLCMSDYLGSGIGLFTGMFIVTPVFTVCFFFVWCSSPSSRYPAECPDVIICIGICFLITSIALIVALKFPQMNSVFFKIMNPTYAYEHASHIVLYLIIPMLLITGVLSLIFSVYSVSNNVFCNYDFRYAYKEYFEDRTQPFSQYEEKSTNNINHGIPSLPSDDEITKHYIMYTQYDQQAMQIDTPSYIKSIQTEKIETYASR